MKKNINWFKIGQDIATGKKGTRWMAVDNTIMKEAFEEKEGESIPEKFRNYAEGWKDTEQWYYEIGSKMSPQIKDGDINEERQDEEDDFFQGYIDVMMKKAKKMKKLKGVI